MQKFFSNSGFVASWVIFTLKGVPINIYEICLSAFLETTEKRATRNDYAIAVMFFIDIGTGSRGRHPTRIKQKNKSFVLCQRVRGLELKKKRTQAIWAVYFSWQQVIYLCICLFASQEGAKLKGHVRLWAGFLIEQTFPFPLHCLLNWMYA